LSTSVKWFFSLKWLLTFHNVQLIFTWLDKWLNRKALKMHLKHHIEWLIK
jgi:hypothetical protein